MNIKYAEQCKIMALSLPMPLSHFHCIDAFDFELLESTLKSLLQGQSVDIPVYDLKRRCR
jgi:hypothetical protein